MPNTPTQHTAADWRTLIAQVTRELWPDLVDGPRWIEAQVHTESAGDPHAVSVSGARGLLQLMPGTAAELGVLPHEVESPQVNLRAGVRYLRIQFEHFPEIPDRLDRLRWSFAAYNCGRGYCLEAGTPVTRADFTQMPIEALNVGDEVLAFDERPFPSGHPRQFRRAAVTGVIARRANTVRLHFEDSAPIVCSQDHPWLKAGGWNASRPEELHRFGFMPASRLKPGNNLQAPLSTPAPGSSSNRSADYKAGYLSGAWLGDGSLGSKRQAASFACESPEFFGAVIEGLRAFGIDHGRGRSNGLHTIWLRGRPRAAANERLSALLWAWSDSIDFQRGFLAGIYDAEGSCEPGQLSIAQKNSTTFGQEVLRRVVACCAALSIPATEFRRSNRDASEIRINGTQAIARFLALTRPRIPHKMGGVFGVSIRGRRRIAAIESAGIREVHDISTTTGTFIAAGLASHNCNKALSLARDAGVRDWSLWHTGSHWLADERCLVNRRRPDFWQVMNYVSRIERYHQRLLTEEA